MSVIVDIDGVQICEIKAGAGTYQSVAIFQPSPEIVRARVLARISLFLNPFAGIFALRARHHVSPACWHREMA